MNSNPFMRKNPPPGTPHPCSRGRPWIQPNGIQPLRHISPKHRFNPLFKAMDPKSVQRTDNFSAGPIFPLAPEASRASLGALSNLLELRCSTSCLPPPPPPPHKEGLFCDAVHRCFLPEGRRLSAGGGPTQSEYAGTRLL